MEIKTEKEDYYEVLNYNLVKEEYVVQEHPSPEENEDIPDSKEDIQLKIQEMYEGERKHMRNVKKKITKKYKSYTQEQVSKALEAFRQGKSLHDASTLFGVPKTTLFNKITKKCPEECSAGRRPTLPKEMEDEIVEWILGCVDKWHPITKDQILDTVQLMCKKFKIANDFTDGRPGYNWFKNFLKRHPELSRQTLESNSTQRISVTPEDINEWFEKTGEYLESNDLLELPPDRVFNLDETSVMLSPKGEEVMAKKGSISSDDKDSVTVLFTISAAGKLPPPMVVHRRQLISKVTASCNVEGWAMGLSESGWMTSKLFYEYITNSFYNWLLKQKIQFPVILYLDGHASHITLELSKFCKSKGIELILLYPNATHLLQPLDTSFFLLLQEKYKVALAQWRMENGGKLKPRNLAKVLSDALSLLDLENIASSGFSGCGLLPFNQNGIDNAMILNGSKDDRRRVKRNKKSLINSKENPITHAEYKIALRVLRNHVPPAVLKQFSDHGEKLQWDGAIENENLFYFWRNVKRRYKSSGVSEKAMARSSADSSRIIVNDEDVAGEISERWNENFFEPEDKSGIQNQFDYNITDFTPTVTIAYPSEVLPTSGTTNEYNDRMIKLEKNLNNSHDDNCMLPLALQGDPSSPLITYDEDPYQSCIPPPPEFQDASEEQKPILNVLKTRVFRPPDIHQEDKMKQPREVQNSEQVLAIQEQQRIEEMDQTKNDRGLKRKENEECFEERGLNCRKMWKNVKYKRGIGGKKESEIF